MQKIITDVSKEYQDITAKAWTECVELEHKFCMKLGHEFIQLSNEELAVFKEAAKAVFTEFISIANEKGVDREGIFRRAKEMA